MKRLFEKTKRLAQDHRMTSTKLWGKINKYLGFEPDPFQLDSLVDTLEQGIGELDYESFIQILDNYKEGVSQK